MGLLKKPVSGLGGTGGGEAGNWSNFSAVEEIGDVAMASISLDRSGSRLERRGGKAAIVAPIGSASSCRGDIISSRVGAAASSVN